MLSSRRLIFPLYLIASLFLFIAPLPASPATVSDAIARPAVIAAVPVEQSLETITRRDGLAGNFVTAVAIAADGTIWAGTTTGATHIEPARWTTYTHVHGLGDDWITSIAVAPDGSVWFGTQSGGVSAFDGEEFTTYDITNSAIPSNLVTGLAIDSGGTVWIGTLDAGVASYSPASKRWTRFRLVNNSVTALVIGPDSLPWAGTDGGGAFKFDGTAWKQVELPGSGRVIRFEDTSYEGFVITTPDGRFHTDGRSWTKLSSQGLIEETASALSLQTDQIADFAADLRGNNYFATPVGLAVSMANRAYALNPPKPLPVVVVHGWTVSASDEIQDGEFRFLQQYARADGIPVYYAKGINPKNTLFENAVILKDDIAAVRQETGAEKVNLIAFSMGGLNARAYLESALYQYDVNRVIILGTPEAGVDIWKPILAEQIIQKPDEPSAIELTPEYSQVFNQTHAPRSSVPYDLLVGDARKQPQLEFISDLPPNDGLIGVASALSLEGTNVRKAVDDDLHAFDPISIPFYLTSYLYPRDTYDRYLRNALRDPTNAPIGSEVTPIQQPTTASGPLQANIGEQPGEGNHTPVVTAFLAAGETITRTVTLDVASHARFLAYFPGGDVDMSLQGPDGKIYNSAIGSIQGPGSGSSSGGAIRLKADIASFVGYSLTDPLPGAWSLVLTRTDKGSEPLDVTTYVDLDSKQGLIAGVNRDSINLGDSITISASLTIPITNAQLSARIASPGPNPGDAYSFSDLPLLDEGNGDFAARYTPARGGYYLVFVNAHGPGLARAREILFSVNPGGAKLPRVVEVHPERDGSGVPTGLSFGVDLQAQRPGAYAIGATLHRPGGQVVARVTAPVNLAIGDNQAVLVFRSADLAAPGPYSLDLSLLDTSWAAIPIDGEESVATVQP